MHRRRILRTPRTSSVRTMAAAMIPADLNGFVEDALKRAALLPRAASSHVVTVDADAVVKQANAVVIPCKIWDPVRPDGGVGDWVQHLVIKHVDISAVRYRDDEHRERTRASYACECAFYRVETGKRMETKMRTGSTTAADKCAVPAAYLVEGGEASDVFTLVMDDARFTIGGGGGGGADGGVVSPTAAGGMGMSVAEAEAAVEWLASFHARHWVGLPSTPRVPAAVSKTSGGYWNLEKRVGDLDGMEAEWDKMLAAFPGEETLEAHKGLASRLKSAAPAISRATRRGGAGGGGGGGGQTLVHGDFKQANIITPSSDADQSTAPSAPAPVVVDWQWCGPGRAAHDVVYLLATSLSCEALAAEEELLARYHRRLTEDLRTRLATAGTAAADAADVYAADSLYSLEALRLDVAVHAADYCRFLIGSMWGGVTPSSMQAKAGAANQGMHKRSLTHLTWVVRKAAQGLGRVACSFA